MNQKRNLQIFYFSIAPYWHGGRAQKNWFKNGFLTAPAIFFGVSSRLWYKLYSNQKSMCEVFD